MKKQSHLSRVHEAEGEARAQVPYHQTRKDKRHERKGETGGLTAQHKKVGPHRHELGALKSAVKEHAPKMHKKARHA